MKKIITIMLLCTTVLLVGCGSRNFTKAEIEDATYAFFDDLGVSGAFDKQVDHVNLTEYDYTSSKEDTKYYNVYHFILAEDASESGFYDLVKDKYKNVKNYAICNAGRSVLVVLKFEAANEGDDWYKYNQVPLNEDDKKAARDFATSIEGSFTFVEKDK